ncbi:unnamed protein product [Blepharisma stoltei]|uniref:Pectinesterase inhibitor domain-containing protein n=1 Tax=Blepharisma stoltei TaxID=1481888 RepID=A0AAU9JSJ9_9CILI|nr:unnamed protein product [Blepharisma stoltei]
MKFKALILLTLVVGNFGKFNQELCVQSLENVAKNYYHAVLYWNSFVYFKEAIQSMGAMLTSIGLALNYCDFLSDILKSESVEIARGNLLLLGNKWESVKEPKVAKINEVSGGSEGSCMELTIEVIEAIDRLAESLAAEDIYLSLTKLMGATGEALRKCENIVNK